MTLIEHLQELRRRIVYALLALVVGTLIGFFWYQHAPFGWSTLGEILREPYCALPADKRADFTNDGTCRLLATTPFEMLMLRIKVGALAGAVISSPVWLYQVWAFIVPGLHKKEKRYTFMFVSVAGVLFVAGAALAYFVLSEGLEFLMSIGAEYQTAALTGKEYFGLMLTMLILFGIAFEVPLIIIALNLVGVLEYEHVKGKRRILFIIVMIISAFITPADPYSLIALSGALWLLIESAFQFCRINDKRRNRERPDWMDLDDEQASPLGSGPGAVGLAEPVPAPSPVNPPSSHPSAPAPARPASAQAQPQRQQNSRPARPQQPESGFFDDVL
ncbi:twin-arginine translocase subunit TatC [Corynebacterium sp. HMSC04H06]|uniref:twin-arginine translocase subunit TatC n=1 Tax=Corynebacterium sp. HMSC04H06 TaxID=1581050 RepID=UPI0008A346C6|nr:twin-arginine translocase subunit TatC [Corynebacterium sp. HMSC04H06]OFS23217.1 twin arginine-targeting protein translocase TatC [Corynebacterium sp. HMSC04H06]